MKKRGNEERKSKLNFEGKFDIIHGIMHQSFCHERAAYLIQVGVDVSQNDELVDGNGIFKIYPEINPVQQRDIHSGKSPILSLIHCIHTRANATK